MGARFEIVHAAFSESSIGQFASVTCVDAPRLPINPAIYISSTSRNRRPMRHVEDTSDMMPGLKKKRKERTWPLPVRVLPCIFAGVVPVRPWVVKCQSLQM